MRTNRVGHVSGALLGLALLASVAINSADAQSASGRINLRGIVNKTFDSCGGGAPASFTQRLVLTWAAYVSFLIRDRNEEVVVSGGPTNGAVVGSQTYPLTGGGYVEFAYIVNGYRTAARPRLQKFLTLLDNNGQYICQVTYEGRLNQL